MLTGTQQFPLLRMNAVHATTVTKLRNIIGSRDHIMIPTLGHQPLSRGSVPIAELRRIRLRVS